MSIYAFANMSGSVGKTTTVVCLAVLAARAGLRVRVIDIDPQANASTLLGYPAVEGATVADILRERCTVADVERPARTVYNYSEDGDPLYSDEPDWLIENLSVVPAARSTLEPLTVELPAVMGGAMRLRDALEVASPVDVTLIDAPGTNNALVTNAVMATAAAEGGPAGSWGVITCTKPAGKESEGLADLLRELSIIKKTFRVDIPLLAIIPCAVPSNKATVYAEQLKYLREGFGTKVAPVVRARSIVDEAYTNYVPVPLFGYRAKDTVQDYEAVMAYLNSELGLFRPTSVKA